MNDLQQLVREAQTSRCPGHPVFKKRMMEVSDTHKARRRGSPGHRAGNGKELSSSFGVVSSYSR